LAEAIVPGCCDNLPCAAKAPRRKGLRTVRVGPVGLGSMAVRGRDFCRYAGWWAATSIVLQGSTVDCRMVRLL